MIKMELLNSTVSDETLRLVAIFCGRNTSDMLLYSGEEWYNLEGLVRPDEREYPTPCPKLTG